MVGVLSESNWESYTIREITLKLLKLLSRSQKTDQYDHGTCGEETETKQKDCPIYCLKNYLMQKPKVKGPLSL